MVQDQASHDNLNNFRHKNQIQYVRMDPSENNLLVAFQGGCV